jgi:hypothetical protein
MELEYQWDLLEETIPDAFTELLDSLKSRFQDLKSLLRGESIDTTVQILSDSSWCRAWIYFDICRQY